MKKAHINLKDTDRTYLENLVKKGSLPSRTYKRAIALLELDRGRTFTDVAETVGVVIQTASGWADKYEESGLEFLTDKPIPGRPVVINGEQRAKITALACSDPPEGYERWSLRLLADKVVEFEYVEAISYVEVGRILKKTNSSRT
jgi:transposase